MRISAGVHSISIWSPEIFGRRESFPVEDFLARTFSVAEVKSVELQRAKSFGRIRYGAVASPRKVWKELSLAISGRSNTPPPAEEQPIKRIDASGLYLAGPDTRPVQVSRVGRALSTWHVLHQSEGALRLWHPLLRTRRDVVFRLEEELAAILGVEDFRTSTLTGGVAIRFDKKALKIEHLARELEKAWPRLLDGLDGPPSRKRFVAAAGLLGLAFTGQYLVPALRPLAVAGVLLYGLPNVANGVKQLARGEVGLYVMYSAGVGFLLISGLPFASSVIALLMQFWPYWARRKFVSSQRRLFARQRRRPVWARLPGVNGTGLEVSVDDLRKDDLVVVRSGEIVPADGVVQEGSALVVEGAPFGADQIEQKSPGDQISGGAFVRDGDVTIRVERTGLQIASNYIASLLPHVPLKKMPSLLEVERIANRNAKPALALSALNLTLTRDFRRSQAVIRPDYATAPRLSAQLSALHSLARAAQQGIFFRNPAALDRLGRPGVYVIDDSAGLERRRVAVGTVRAAKGFTEALVAGYALVASGNTERNWALATLPSILTGPRPKGTSLRHHAGVTRFRDSSGNLIEVATTAYVGALNLDVAKTFHRTLTQDSVALSLRHPPRDEEGPLRPLWVLRNNEVIGVVSFARTGELVGKRIVAAIKNQDRGARLVYLSRTGQSESQALATSLDIELSHGAMDQRAKAELIRGLGRPAVWVGNGAHPDVSESIAASAVSVSVAPARDAPQDFADILLPRHGLDDLPVALEVAREHELRLARDYRTVNTTNLLGVGGAFFARWSALQAGLLSNVGTAIVYARRARALDKLAPPSDEGRHSGHRSLPI